MGKYIDTLQLLGTWFERQKRVLPWRDDPSPYRVWISEIMLQQTQVITVIPYFEKFMGRFPSVRVLAGAPEDEVLRYWAGLGYYSRARNLHRGAQAIVARGEFPRSREEWLSIPGVGPYTAGAILSISSDLPEPIVDGNVERVLSRVRRISRARGEAAYKQRLWRLAARWVRDVNGNGVRPSVFNQAMMELGATVCTPRKPQCLLCPLQGLCRAKEQGDAEAYPPRKPRREWKRVRETLHCVLNSQGQVLLRKRPVGSWRAGLWDLLEKEPAEKAQSLGAVQTSHVVTHHKITRETRVWRAVKPSTPVSPDLRWVSLDEPEVAVGSALKRTLEAVRNLL